ncbi:MAG: cell wall hydrolase [Reyranella sp.]|nr:cell wall hydrolase [Reyranella sp.]
MIKHDAEDVMTLARTLWGEARGEGRDGMVAVAWVIRNRAARTTFAGGRIGDAGAVARVCKAPWQFSCWNEGDPNRDRLLRLGPDDCVEQIRIAEAVLADPGLDAGADPTGGADHYHTIDAPAWAQTWPPGWASTMAETARFGGHVFYNSQVRP